MAVDGDEDRRVMLGDLVQEARRRKFESVQGALQASGLNRATWLRIEDGQRVRDDRLTAAEKALDWPPGIAFRVIAGRSGSIQLDPNGHVVSEVVLDEEESRTYDGIPARIGTPTIGSALASNSSPAPNQPPVERLTDMELLSELGRRLSRRAVTDDEWNRIQAYENAPELFQDREVELARYTAESENPHPKDSVDWRQFEEVRETAKFVLTSVVELYESGNGTLPGRPVEAYWFGDGSTVGGVGVQIVWEDPDEPDDELARRRNAPPQPPAQAPPLPEDVAAHDPGKPSEGQLRRDQQDRDAEDGDE